MKKVLSISILCLMAQPSLGVTSGELRNIKEAYELLKRSQDLVKAANISVNTPTHYDEMRTNIVDLACEVRKNYPERFQTTSRETSTSGVHEKVFED